MNHREITINIPPPEVHRYLVGYWWEDGATHGHGSFVVDLEAPIRSAEHIVDLHLMATDDSDLSALATVHILNIIRLDTL